jgi:tetratricopeptide (TPR) repeat protein
MAKLIRYCEGMMEATWLSALVCIPLFFALWGNSLQDAKSYLLRSFAIVLGTAWVVSLVARAGFGTGDSSPSRFSLMRLMKTPLAGPTMILALALVTATLLSLSPWISFWGTTVRRSGACTTLSCMLFFAVMAVSVRSDQQLNRIITVAILTSVPVSLYGIEERYLMGPIVTLDTGNFRVTATLGNAIFLAAYLAMVLPLTVSRILLHRRPPESAGQPRSARRIQTIGYTVVLVLQLWAILFSISRGPIVGLIVGGTVMLLILALYWRQRWLATGILASGVILSATLALLAWPGSPFHRAAKPATGGRLSTIERLTSIFDPQADTSGRTAIWNAAVQAARFSPALVMDEGQKDPLSSARFLFGYGPETVAFVSRAFLAREYNMALTVHQSCDRIHNDFWDTLITTGWLGLAAYLVFTFLAVYYGCKWLGLISTRKQQALFWTFTLVGSLIGSLVLGSWRGPGFLGVGLRFGSSAGLIVYLAWLSWRKEFDPANSSVPIARALVLMALLSGLVAHLIEINFSFGVETTLFYFWIYIALLLTVGYRLPSIGANATTTEVAGARMESMPFGHASQSQPGLPRSAKPMPGANPPAQRHSLRPAALFSFRWEIIGGLITALVLVNLGVILISRGVAHSAVQTIVDALTRSRQNPNAWTESLLFTAVAIALLFAFLWTKEAGQATPQKTWLRSVMVTLTVAGTTALVYWFCLAVHVARMLTLADVSLGTLGQFLKERAFMVQFYYGFTFLLILIMATFLADPPPSDPAQPRRWVWFRYGLAAILAGAGMSVIYTTNLRWAKVEAMDHWALSFHSMQQLPVSVAICEAAIKATPKAEHQYFFLGKVLTDQAVATTDADQRQALFLKADQVLEAGHKVSPIDHAFLIRRGHLYQKWAETEPNQDRKMALGRQAIAFFQRAARVNPGNNDLWYRMAYTAMAVFRSPDEAQPWLVRSLELYPDLDTAHGLLGDVFFNKGLAARDQSAREVFFRSAATNYLQANRLSGTNDASASIRYNAALGKSHGELKDLPAALSAYEKAVLAAPPKERWKCEEILARLFGSRNDKTNSAQHWQRAIELAPEEKRARLIQLKTEMLSRP